jgi:nucleotide-binding universal stress UspA family protein
MYKHILVAVDGSETSNLALKEAIRLAKEQEAALRLIHVVDETPIYMTVEAPYPIREYQDALKKAGEKELADCAAEVRNAGLVPEIKLSVVDTVSQRICDMINEEARQWPADLIVIGTHGRRGFNHLLLGSVAEGVIHLATRPVLIFRKS